MAKGGAITAELRMGSVDILEPFISDDLSTLSSNSSLFAVMLTIRSPGMTGNAACTNTERRRLKILAETDNAADLMI